MKARSEQGIFLITFAIWAVVLLGVAGVALDGGRLFINRNEAQTYADAAALAAAQKLDGTPAGIHAARLAVRESGNSWDFGTQKVHEAAVEFGSAGTPDHWTAEPGDATGLTRVRVTAQVNQRLFFAPLFVVRSLQLVRVRAVAEQTRGTQFAQGVWPFSVLAFKGQAEPHFGLQAGRQYTIRYVNGKGCEGDAQDPAHLRTGGSRTWWGRYTDGVLRERVVVGRQAQGEELTIGKPLPEVTMPLAGAAEYIEARRSQDTDSASVNYAAYSNGGTGNGRRIAVLPIQDAELSTVRAFGMFFILPLDPEPQGKPWCVEYIGGAMVPNSNRPGAGAPGVYAIRLVR